MHVLAADDRAARSALQEAFSRQESLPGYVEHLFGRVPVIPIDGGEFADTVTERVTEKAREKVSEATARAPTGSILADSALAHLQQETEEELVIALGPEQEFLTIQHAGKWQRETFSEGSGELVRANGRMALMLNLEPQIARLKGMAALDSAEMAIEQAQSIRASLRGISMGLVETGAAGLFGVAVGIFDEVSQLLAWKRSNAEILRAASALEKMSGRWQCTRDDSIDDKVVDSAEVRQLADESINGELAHVYEETRVFEANFRMQTLTWTRVSDGLPIRSVFVMPTGDRQRTEYEYPASVSFELPDCVKLP